MTLPLYDDGAASGLLCGILFGYVLENAGFGSPRKLTAQFRFSDWSVFKVMLTAVIVAAIGLYMAAEARLLPANSVYIPTTFFWATLTGGALIGAGMAVGGYCPGTAAVGLATGRVDGLFFIAGLVLGTALFAGVFDPISGFYEAAQGPEAQTLSAFLEIPTLAALGILITIAVIGFRVGTWFEGRHGGVLTAEQLIDGRGMVVDEVEIVNAPAS
jgi:hypothetical protein